MKILTLVCARCFARLLLFSRLWKMKTDELISYIESGGGQSKQSSAPAEQEEEKKKESKSKSKKEKKKKRELEKKKEREKKLIEKYEPYIDQQTR